MTNLSPLHSCTPRLVAAKELETSPSHVSVGLTRLGGQPSGIGSQLHGSRSYMNVSMLNLYDADSTTSFHQFHHHHRGPPNSAVDFNPEGSIAGMLPPFSVMLVATTHV